MAILDYLLELLTSLLAVGDVALPVHFVGKWKAGQLDVSELTATQQQMLNELWLCGCVKGGVSIDKLIRDKCLDGGKKCSRVEEYDGYMYKCRICG